jgi:hypothetical protein
LFFFLLLAVSLSLGVRATSRIPELLPPPPLPSPLRCGRRRD